MRVANVIPNVPKSLDFAALRLSRTISVIAVVRHSKNVAHVVQMSMNGTVESLDSGLRL